MQKQLELVFDLRLEITKLFTFMRASIDLITITRKEYRGI